jgi:PRD1 phage membrane DNA delivery
MSDIMKDLTAVLMAVIGVAILAVLVSQRNNTVGVINAASGGFGSILGVAMGGGMSGSGFGLTG